jgi:hypothetical protein
MVVPPMQSISGDDGGTFVSHMVRLTAGMLGLPCRPCLRGQRLIAGKQYYVVAILGVHLLSHKYASQAMARLF